MLREAKKNLSGHIIYKVAHVWGEMDTRFTLDRDLLRDRLGESDSFSLSEIFRTWAELLRRH